MWLLRKKNKTKNLYPVYCIHYALFTVSTVHSWHVSGSQHPCHTPGAMGSAGKEAPSEVLGNQSDPLEMQGNQSDPREVS